MKPPLSDEDAAGDLRREPPAIRWLLLLQRLVIIGLSAGIALQLPLPLLADWLPVKNVVVAIGAIGLTGKALIDTLFFDRYWP